MGGLMLDRRQLLLSGAGFAIASRARAQAAVNQRNTVLIMSDDLLSVLHDRTKYGPSIHTPNMNRLMGQSLTFTNAFASTAKCHPSRTSIVTGKNPYKTGIHDNEGAPDWFVNNPPEETFIGRLKQAGRSVFLYGKVTHSGMSGWDGIATDAKMNFPGDTDAGATDAAIAALRTARRPFFIALGLRNPHAPFESPAQFYEPYPLADIRQTHWEGDEPPTNRIALAASSTWADLEASGMEREYIRDYLANVTEMDHHLGRTVSAIDALAIPNLMVVFSGDHGYHLGERDVVTKFTLWDSAARAPLIVRVPSIEPRYVPDVVSLLDIAPTFMAACGIDRPLDWDGRSLLNYKDPSYARAFGVLTTMNDSTSYREETFRITEYGDGGIEHFDVLADPREQRNLAEEPEFAIQTNARLAVLRAELRKWRGLK